MDKEAKRLKARRKFARALSEMVSAYDMGPLLAVTITYTMGNSGIENQWTARFTLPLEMPPPPHPMN